MQCGIHGLVFLPDMYQQTYAETLPEHGSQDTETLPEGFVNSIAVVKFAMVNENILLNKLRLGEPCFPLQLA